MSSLIKALAAIGTGLFAANAAEPLAIGAKLPQVSQKNQEGINLALAEHGASGWLLVYFYPKADTPGCTTQSCGLRDIAKKIGDTVIIGISPDLPAKLAKFDDKYKLGFTLLSDPEHVVAEKFGVWGEKSMYGKKYMGVARTTYVIGPDGKVALRIDKVRPEGHADEVIAAIKALTSAACTPSNSASSASTKARSSPRTKAKTPRASTSTPASKRR
jgi:peroxiredoxin Q/BCP